jgi:G3E family GTPase
MQIEDFLRVNVVSGLAAAGKSSVARALGGTAIHPLALMPDDAAVLAKSPLAYASWQAWQGSAVPGRREVFVEAHPSIGPLEVASFLAPARKEQRGAPRVRLGDLITVLDASSFWEDVQSDASDGSPALTQFGDAKPAVAAPASPHPVPSDRTRGDALIEQVEWASVVVINKSDLVQRAECGDIRDFVRLLNPSSFIVFAIHGEGAAATWPVPRRDMHAWLASSPGWVRQLNGDALLSQSPQGLSCVVYRDVRPFHPARLAHFFAHRSGESGDILRSRGLCRLASRPGVVGSWSSVGGTVTFEPTGMLASDPDSTWGQEIAFFGRHLDVNRLTRNLNECLLTDEEFLAGPVQWCNTADPFPAWDLQHRR